ncbi:unnamed protein product [Acanthoscelides obtectus]|uniref:CDP-diacylglycerol--glycerol-3-phosphate 3-phosphatidyltransferase n=1 Tax=Acanthoscelides obtectus TaxID=200917 RepID=A0A9P0KJ51_ACAOB|nr:unnamed protein product [Acanthoscelides obtectus]CAK1664282.1 CDP-diacylglycerol--glycerol-3-phosphate 3-phosphatidyltransferase, mitochondrial [Acanthoscelides obtectus]
MIRRILNSIVESASQPIEPTIFPHPFTKPETVPFSWLTTRAPCFPIKADNVTILTKPEQFYNILLKHCQYAKDRVTLASLYIGNGDLEKKLVGTLKSNKEFLANKLKINILLDYTRGSRYENNSRTILLPLVQQSNNCTVSLYHTPVLRGILKRYTPDRWNELYGLQHMKLYIFDDTLIISGANLSNDYFTNRQDRYIVIKDKRLSDFYCGLVNRVQKFSLKMNKDNHLSLDSDWKILPYQGNKFEFIEKSADIIEQYMVENIQENAHKEEGFDTWMFPMVQMGQLGIEQDAQITDKILADTPPNSRLKIATGYFNLTNQFTNTIIRKSKAQCDILMAHPKANGFFGAQGVAGGIPYAYSLIARTFKENCKKAGQEQRVKLFEYFREGWTYHGKGLWYYPPNQDTPCVSLIGSPNFGERSVKKDLESQMVIITENETLRDLLHEECRQLFQQGLPADTNRKGPLWVHTFVLLFKSYF